MTTASQAEKRGYRFSGAYSSSDFEYIKQRATEFRKMGVKALIVFIPGNRSNGKSVYIKCVEHSPILEREINIDSETKMKEYFCSKCQQVIKKELKNG